LDCGKLTSSESRIRGQGETMDFNKISQQVSDVAERVADVADAAQ
jgi:uncharacterized protein Yka (UPF0111/DUF47 family)